jgi:multiple sugar transport system ATP-binding protein
MADLKLESVTKRFGTTTAVEGLQLDVESGEFIVLLGPSGAGKTTTLRLVAGLERPDQGSVFIGGRDVTGVAPALRDVTFVFQQYSLYPHLSVFDNLAFPLRSPLRRLPADQIRTKVEEIARLLRIEDKLQSPATRLSGGQMQRVAIGRALVRNPAITLMDEPLSSLDARLRDDLRLELKRIHAELKATMLYVTHDQIEAMTLATKVGVLENGRLVQVGSPRQIYEEPVSSYVASRLGSPHINLVPRGALGNVLAPERAVTAGLRAEHWGLDGRSDSDAGVAGRVVRLESLSDQRLAQVEIEGTGLEIVTAVGLDVAMQPGDAVRLRPRKILWFDGDGQRVRM